MKFFIVLSLLIHAASLAFFMWHKNQDTKLVKPPMSTMVQIVSTPEDQIDEETSDLSDKDLSKSIKTKTIQKKTTKRIKTKTMSRKGPSLEELEYAQKLQRFIEENRFYPQRSWRLKQEGTVLIALTILNDGSFSNIELIEKSKHQSLNQAAVKFLENLKKFKPLPNPIKKKQEYLIPIFYKIES